VGQEGGGIRDRTQLDASRDVATAAPLQVAVLAAIVATLLYFPLGLAIVLVLRIAGIGFETVATFGGLFGVFLGLMIWWLLVFAGAFAYAACLFPWRDKVLGWPKKQ
jgi:hypothetical protein